MLVNFYDPEIQGPDSQGRTLDMIIKWSDWDLETKHDYIQWLFPLPEESNFNDEAPTVDEETMLYFRQNEELKKGLKVAFIRMLWFYGFEADYLSNVRGEGEAEAEEAEGLETLRIQPKGRDIGYFSRWLSDSDHNHMRISRIIRSLRVFGMHTEAATFYFALLDTKRDFKLLVGEQSLSYWNRAFENPLFVAPDSTVVSWLRAHAGPPWDDQLEESNSPRSDEAQTGLENDHEDDHGGCIIVVPLTH